MITSIFFQILVSFFRFLAPWHSDGFSRSGSGTCSGNTWGTRHVPCSLFPVPCSLKDSPAPKKKFAVDAAKFNLRRPCGPSRFARLTCSLFPVPCSHKTPLREHVFSVPCSLSPYGKTHRCVFSRSNQNSNNSMGEGQGIQLQQDFSW